MRIVVVNAGSSSLKVSVVDDGVRTATFDSIPDRLPSVDAVGHRIVHGGRDFLAPVVVDAGVEAALRDLVDLAPLHQPKSLAALDDARARFPSIPHVACFDTAFHANLSPAVSTYALPRQWRDRWDLRRYGFHGLSHAWSARRAAEMLPGARRLVIAHLGAGASLAAVLDGGSVDTTMGFTPLDGLVMATRSGSVDPGLLLWLEERVGISPAELAEALENRSGLLGLAGSADLRLLLARDDAEARLAVEVYLHRLASSIAAMTVSLGGLDALVFTGGVGEHAPEIRRRSTNALRHLGLGIDADDNRAPSLDADVTSAHAIARTLVIAACEDLEIASGVRVALGA